MTKVSMTIAGEEEAIATLAKVPGAIDTALTQGVHAVALVALSEYRRAILKGPKTGRTYKRGKNGTIIHRASAPGEAPANDTGALIRSSYAEVGEEMRSADVGATSPYAAYLEFGTRRMAARPALRPAAMYASIKGPQILDAYIKQALSQIDGSSPPPIPPEPEMPPATPDSGSAGGTGWWGRAKQKAKEAVSAAGRAVKRIFGR